MNLKTLLARWSIIAALIPMLAGCFGAVAVGVGASALLLADRRVSEVYLADEGNELRAGNRISEKFGERVHVNVTSYNRTLLLTGEVPDETTKAEVEKIVAALPNARAIVNELQIAGPSSLGARSNDSFITSKVKGRFIDTAKFSAHLVKVVTEGGTVYLMGLVTRSEADAAVEIARTTGGVQKVVRVLEVISDEEARRLDSRPANGAGAPAADANRKQAGK